ncbi:MAG: hypothetical protein HWD82_08395 [Flavobacteriaceae bacterium]|nr:hypothetical protein [Flavobacteriaceae bacterium]
MKKLTITAILVVFTTFTTFSNNDNEDKKEVVKKELKTTIKSLLSSYDNKLDSNANATINFIINSKGEIIVLSVETDKQEIASYIKTKLNYKKTSLKNIKKLEAYTLPVKFTKA